MKNIIEKILIEKNILTSYKIIEGNDGIDILKYVIDLNFMQKICLIITDENMEFMQGSTSIKFIRLMESFNKIPRYTIFSVTSYEDKISCKLIKSSGADIILNKPFNKDMLKKMMKKFKIF